MQQDPFRGIDSQPVEELRVLEGQLNHLSDLGYHRLETADVLVDHRGHSALRALHSLGQKLNIRPLSDLDYSRRTGGYYSQLDLTKAKSLGSQKAPE